jgi:hypothetical protein
VHHHVRPPAFDEREEIVEHRRGGQGAEQPREHVARKLLGREVPGFEVAPEVLLAPFGRREPRDHRLDAGPADDGAGVGAGGPAEVVTCPLQRRGQRDEGVDVADGWRRRDQDPHHPIMSQ